MLLITNRKIFVFAIVNSLFCFYFSATPEQIAEDNQRNDQILNNFWTNLMSLLDNAPDRSMLQDIIVTTLKVLNADLPDSWINTEQRVS
jgi:hypothetical protein